MRQTPRSSYGLQASGGSDLLRFFVSGTHQGETGPFVMPDSEIKRITAVARHGAALDAGVSESTAPGQLPRQLPDRAGSRTRRSTSPRGYSDRTLWQPFDGGFFAGLTFQLMTAPGCAIRCTATLRSDGTWTNGTQREYVGDVFSVDQKTNEQRFTGSGALNWAPMRLAPGSLDGRHGSVQHLRRIATSSSAKDRTRPPRGARTRRRRSPARTSSATTSTATRSISAPPRRDSSRAAFSRRPPSARSGSRTKRIAAPARAMASAPACRRRTPRRSDWRASSRPRTRPTARSFRKTSAGATSVRRRPPCAPTRTARSAARSAPRCIRARRCRTSSPTNTGSRTCRR